MPGIVDYEPTELVITARGGTPLATLEATLAKHGQTLAFEPPHFGPRATLGGCVAAGLSGPRRAYAGALRDFVLGVRLLDGKGDDLHFGGRVMKNVAGFDVSRLIAGSLGTLGVVLEVSLKVLPRAGGPCHAAAAARSGGGCAPLQRARRPSAAAQCHRVAGRHVVDPTSRCGLGGRRRDAPHRRRCRATRPKAKRGGRRFDEQTAAFFAGRRNAAVASLRASDHARRCRWSDRC